MLHREDSVLERSQWTQRMEMYQDRVSQWICPHLGRKSRQEKHPVYDFLFDYYSFRPGLLLRWSPGPNVLLLDAGEAFAGRKGFVGEEGKVVLGSFPANRYQYVVWAVQYLEQITTRTTNYSCLGLHEWAMVYRTSRIRHHELSLRVGADSVADFVDRQELFCTHFDAFRFFSDAARPRNRPELRRNTSSDWDQRACIHVNMDLYKFCYKIYPWIESELLADAFELAIAAREIDMRASPYDLASFGFEPIRIETAEGRAEYVRLQKNIAAKAQPIRARVLRAYRELQ